MHRTCRTLLGAGVCIQAFVALLAPPAGGGTASRLYHDPPEVSSGGMANLLSRFHPLRGIPGPQEPPSLYGPESFAIGSTLEAYSFTDNATLNSGSYFIPPDAIGAAGEERLIAIVNAGIECRNKSGTLQWRSSLRNFFSSTSGNLGTTCFDPKIVYDHYEGRFVVVALEQTSAASGGADESRILVAVSQHPFPNGPGTGNWYLHAIDSKIQIGGGQ
ncbi:MAG: hypothetical protein EHM35_18910, partial [Planctomycetaceae bacterium]